MAEPLVSVVVPVHAGERFLASTLDSLAAQTHDRIETVVVDDGSPDRSGEIAAGHAVGARVIRQRNRGVAAARNAGVAATSGEWLAFLDQDDIWHPRKLEHQLQAFAADPGLDLVLTQIDMHLTAGTPRPPWFELHWNSAPQSGFIPSTWLLRRSVFELVGPFDTTLEIASDSEWLSRFADLALRRVMLEQPLVTWRVHGENSSYGQRTMKRELLSIARRRVARSQARGDVA